MVYRLMWHRKNSSRSVIDYHSLQSRGYKRLYKRMRLMNSVARAQHSPIRYFIEKVS